MEKSELLRIAESLYAEAFNTNSYYSIIKQYGDFISDYYMEMNVSPAFYGVIYDALVKACFMNVSKLFECSNEAISIGTLIKYCLENSSIFNNDSYEYRLKKEEEIYFGDLVKERREKYKRIGLKSPETEPVIVNITFIDHIKMYKKRLSSLSKITQNVGKQRRKIYAHNDILQFSNIDQVLKNNPVSFLDLKVLIDFALDCICLVIENLTGTSKDKESINIDDWEKTLNLVKIVHEFRNR